MSFIEWVQRRLIAHNFDPGIIDGIWGRRTRGATIAFQRDRGIPARGRLDEATVKALRKSGETTPHRDLLDIFPWMALAIKKKGLHEKRDNVELRKFLKEDGSTLGDPSKLPWCGDFVETCIAVTLPDALIPTNPYLARNWSKFGRNVTPCFGSVLVFWRGKRNGTYGHVGFYYSEDASNYHVLGGNQDNEISVSKLPKSRLLKARLPDDGETYPQRVIHSADDLNFAESVV